MGFHQSAAGKRFLIVMNKTIIPVIMLLRSALPACAQATFEAAAIKPAAPGARTVIAVQPGGRFVANGVSLKLLTGLAWHLANYQLAGADGWIADAQWTIEAKTDEALTIPAWAPPNLPEVIAIPIRALLEDRFQLKTHHETRNLPVYRLTAGKTGSRLTQADPSSSVPGTFRAGPGAITVTSATMDQLITLLNRMTDRPVIDKTGIAYRFDLKLHFAPESATGPSATDEASLFTALQEQAGLRLEAATEAVDVLVIDSARRPSEN